MPLFGAHITFIPQPGHDPPDYNRVGAHGFRQYLGSGGPGLFGHVEQDVQNA